jgi:hypothetical protein
MQEPFGFLGGEERRGGRREGLRVRVRQSQLRLRSAPRLRW